MKKNKYIYILFASALALGACSSDDAINGEQNKPVPQAGEVLAFNGTISDDMEILEDENLDATNAPSKVKSRIAVNTDFTISKWFTNDKISVSDGTLNYTYSPSQETEGARSSFSTSGNSFTTDGTGDENTFYAFYPSDAVLGWNGAELTTMIWTEQDYTENLEGSGILGPYIAAKAETTGGGANASFDFGHICSVIDVDISGITDKTVDAVSIYGNSQISLAGKLTYNCDTKAIAVNGNDGTGYSYSTQSEMVRVSNVPNGAKTVRFYVLPTKQTQGVTITVHTTDGNYYTKKSANPVGITDINTSFIAGMSGVTNGTPCMPYYKKYKFGNTTANNVRNMNWMAMVPGNIRFTELSIPGTHDAAASSAYDRNAASYYRCQDYDIPDQLANGCRAFDLRPGYNSSDLTIYHANHSFGVTLAKVLTNITDFLAANPTETVFVLLHEETPSLGSYSHQTSWANNIQSCLANYTGYIKPYGWNSTLNACRGKMVIIFRDEYRDGNVNEDKGAGRVGWGSSFNPKTIFTGAYISSDNWGNNSGYTLYYQDEYSYGTSGYNTKLGHLENLLNNYISANETKWEYLYINNTNIASGTTSNATLADGVHEIILGSTTMTQHVGRFGVMFMDYLFSSGHRGDEMFDLVHKQNYTYVYKNRTRCTSTSDTGSSTGANVAGDEYADGSDVFVKTR